MSATAVAPELLVERIAPETALVSINRPLHRNSCNLAVWRGIVDAFAGLGRNGTRLALLTGTGGHFCAGNDINAFAAIRQDPDTEREWSETIVAAYAAVLAAPFPVIAAIEGTCVGGGCSLAMNCDFRVAAEGARFGIPAARLGIMYPTMQTRRLAALIGLRHARRWLYTGSLFDAATAARDGFVDVLAPEDSIAAALAFAQPLLAAAPLSIAGTKRQLNALTDETTAAQWDDLDALYRAAEVSADRAEAEAAFAAKRVPRFTGR